MKIEVGKTYINTDPAAWPEAMRGAPVTVDNIDHSATENQLAVAYSFTDTDGRTGDGTMRLSYAQKFLRVENAQKEHHSIEDVKALDGRIFAMLNPDEEAVLNFYRDQGRKFGVAVSIANEADPEELARASSRQQADQILKSANSRVRVTVT